MLIAGPCLLVPLLGRQGDVGGEQGGDHQLRQPRPVDGIEALQVQRQLLRLEPRKGGHPGTHLLVESMIQGGAGLDEDHLLQALAVGQGIGGLLTQGYLGRHGGEGGLSQQGLPL